MTVTRAPKTSALRTGCASTYLSPARPATIATSAPVTTSATRRDSAPARWPCQDDGTPCTSSVCAQGECTHPAVKEGLPCDDSNSCSTGTTCQQGVCGGGSVTDCDDGNPCTDDDCTPENGCTHIDNQDSCDDGDACTSADTCSQGDCVGTGETDCDDSNPCTIDTCHSQTGCDYVPEADGTSCGVEHTLVCLDGQCICEPDCVDRECGDDGCGGSCGECPAEDHCRDTCLDSMCTPSWTAPEECGNGVDDDCDGMDDYCVLLQRPLGSAVARGGRWTLTGTVGSTRPIATT